MTNEHCTYYWYTLVDGSIHCKRKWRMWLRYRDVEINLEHHHKHG